MSILRSWIKGCLIGALSFLVIDIAQCEQLSAELDYFPSRLHAAIYRNWDIVQHDRLAEVIGTDVATLEKAGKELGLKKVKPLTPEEIRRNVEIVLRRNWPLMPRQQIEQLLGFTAAEVNDFLSKEIFLRALLAGQPGGLTPLQFQEPDVETQARIAWFGSTVKKHLEAVSDAPEEPRLAYIEELCRAHNPADHIRGTKPTRGDVDLRSFRKIQLPVAPSAFLQRSALDFADYCQRIQQTGKIQISEKSDSPRASLRLERDGSLETDESYVLNVEAKAISIRARADVGFARAFVEMERRMAERGGPFLSAVAQTNRPAFSPRFVSSYFSLMADVLGQDVVDPFPEDYMKELFHQDADSIWIYSLLEDLVQSPVFPEIGSAGREARLERLRQIVQRAAKHGLKVYIYLNEPRSQPFAFFEKYPEIKGHVEGPTAMLCTSTELVQKHLRGAFEKLFREVPGLGGVFVITASENWTNCYSRTPTTGCPRCSKRTAADVIAETIRCMAEGTWAADPKAKFIVWDWSWHYFVRENNQEDLIKQLPRGVALMADFERGTAIQRGGIPMTVDEYSISTIGPSPRAKLRSEQAKKYGFDFFAKIQLSTTWECGTVPFIPVPNLLARKAEAMRSVGVSGGMATWTIGSYPSPSTEAFAIELWNDSISEEENLCRIAAKRYGPEAVESAVRGWTKLSNAFTEEFPYSSSPYAGPLQHGPSLPIYRRDIPPPYGNATLFNCKDDWRNWAPPYGPEKMSVLLRHLCERWDDGLRDLREVIEKSSGTRRREAERDFGVAWMVNYYYRAYANALDFYKARDSGNVESMKEIAAREIEHTRQALRYVRRDSRIGWEAEIQYFYRPSDVVERLVSLEAVVHPHP
jgi:hypothetical protein